MVLLQISTQLLTIFMFVCALYGTCVLHRLASIIGEEAYVLSKVFVLMSNTKALQMFLRVRDAPVDVFAVHPGLTDSGWYERDDIDEGQPLVWWFRCVPDCCRIAPSMIV